jgi:hypothetical protein
MLLQCQKKKKKKKKQRSGEVALGVVPVPQKSEFQKEPPFFGPRREKNSHNGYKKWGKPLVFKSFFPSSSPHPQVTAATAVISAARNLNLWD